MNKKTITELSKTTLKSYIKKAKVSSKDQFDKEVDHTIKAVVTPSLKKYHIAQAKNASRKYNNRLKGYNKAYDKLAKEEALDELSKPTLMNYMQKSEADYYKTDDKKKKTKRLRGIVRAGLAHQKKLKEEKVEQIDELSKKTLGKYIKKSLADVEYNTKEYGSTNNFDRGRKHFKVATKHMKGIHKATDKLTKEETENLQELSGSKIGSYLAKSTKQKKETGNTWETDRKEFRKAMRRVKGRKLAVKKLTGDAKVLAKEETINELSKKTLGSYVKKASHDVATKSAATGRYGERSNKALADYKSGKGGYDSWKTSKDNDEKANKFFNKSWKRREGIAKATDKLTKEETLNELSKKLLGRYINKASFQASKLSASLRGKDGIKNYNKTLKRREGIAKATDKLTKEETLNELSKKTLANYVLRAKTDYGESKYRLGQVGNKRPDGGSSRDIWDVNKKNIRKRTMGIKSAVSKLAKESVNEIMETINKRKEQE